jgi:hypothetical protein
LFSGCGPRPPRAGSVLRFEERMFRASATRACASELLTEAPRFERAVRFRDLLPIGVVCAISLGRRLESADRHSERSLTRAISGGRHGRILPSPRVWCRGGARFVPACAASIRRASLRKRSRTSGSTRIAINCRGAPPRGGRPTRRIARSCSSDASGISEKSIRRVGVVRLLSFRLARLALTMQRWKLTRFSS